MYIIYNADGSINKQYLNEFIQEGNSYANVLFVAIIGREPADYYLNAFAKLPNNVNIELPTEDSSLILDGITYVGKNVSITSDATTRPGSLQLNIVAENLPGTERLVSFNLYLTVNETGLAVDDPAVMTIAQYQSLLNRINEIDKFEKIELTGTSGTLTETQIGYITGSVGTYIKNGDEIFWQNKVSESQAEFINTSHAYKKVITINLTNRAWSLFNYQWFDITVSSFNTSGTLTAEQLASLNENIAVRITRGIWVFDISEKSTTNFIFRSFGDNELKTINVNRTSGAWTLSSLTYDSVYTPDNELSTTSENPVQNKVITEKFNSIVADNLLWEENVSLSSEPNKWIYKTIFENYPVKEGDVFCVSVNDLTFQIDDDMAYSISFFDENGTSIDDVSKYFKSTGFLHGNTVTAPANAKTMKVRLGCFNNSMSLRGAVYKGDNDVRHRELSPDIIITEVNKKADKDGYYPDMAVGFTDGYIGNNKDIVVDTFTKKISNHNTCGKINKLYGNTVKFNQILPIKTSNQTQHDVTLTSNGDGTYILNGTNTSSSTIYFYLGAINLPGHKLLLGFQNFKPETLENVKLTDGSSGFATTGYRIQTFSSSCGISITVVAGATVNNVLVKPQIFDLTSMYGDGNEPTLEEFIKQYPNFYSYTSAKLTNVKINGFSAEKTRNIDISKYFPDGMNGVNGIYDEITSSKATKRFIEVDLGTLSWEYQSSNQRFTTPGLRTLIKPPSSTSTTPNAICLQYSIRPFNNTTNKSIAFYQTNAGPYTYIYDSDYTDASILKAALSGVKLVIELNEEEITEIENELNLYFKTKKNIEEKWLQIENHYAPIPSEIYYSKDSIITEIGVPVLYLNGDVSTMTKENPVNLSYIYQDRTGMAEVKWQGASSLIYPKKNLTVKFDNAFEAKEGWGSQRKYVMKANYIDCSHSRNVVGAKLWGKIVQSRTIVPTELQNAPNYGAIDGFPIIIYINDEFMGVYTFNIPKDDWMMGMTGTTTQEAIVCAEDYAFATLPVVDGTDLDIEYAGDEDNTGWIVTSLQTLYNAIQNATEENFEETVGQYIDIDSVIDYIIFSTLTSNIDGTQRNYLLSTFDGTKWFITPYDMDTIFGIGYAEQYLTYKQSRFIFYSLELYPLFYKTTQYCKSKLKQRYLNLTNINIDGALSSSIVTQEVLNFISPVSKTLLLEDMNKWQGLPRSSTSDIHQILNFYINRKNELIDGDIENL